jgi:hypothetical protein
MEVTLQHIKGDTQETIKNSGYFGTIYDEEGEILIQKNNEPYKYSLFEVKQVKAEAGESFEILLETTQESDSEEYVTVVDVVECTEDAGTVETVVSSGDETTSEDSRIISGATSEYEMPYRDYITKNNF